MTVGRGRKSESLFTIQTGHSLVFRILQTRLLAHLITVKLLLYDS